MMTFNASTVHSKLVPKERNLEHRFSRSLGTEKRTPISLKRERESAQPEFARAMRNVSLNASASGGSRPTSVTTPTPKPKTKATSPATTEISGDFFAAIGPTQTTPSTTSDGHMGHFGHFVALPNTGENNHP